ncbi:TraR/DksA C4-type zinc finger protein [Pseudoalteromonas sp. MMG013]|uniref:TraR/DksA C4-type zinc finger protein n=1 Tax=Pseudoalteromonas sp. MMG013 TaxID=2822687 RepID=UPI001B37336E|nr:TraR/DksA C4-type zinc finger protein [Pseudoalteromonas sp. MMG013]MBQ4860498.1 TraR/DksA C4-type zinc finger protein [Pseudoalteromonas sp. MMG013]
MDEADRAQKIIEESLQRKLDEHSKKFAGPDIDLDECEECGAEIPAARKAAIHNCTTCVHCQELIEREQRLFRT